MPPTELASLGNVTTTQRAALELAVDSHMNAGAEKEDVLSFVSERIDAWRQEGARG